MTISDATVWVTCDACNKSEISVLIAADALFSNTIEAEGPLKKHGWKVDGEAHTCPECAGDAP
jgi:hypothetical protein